MKRQTFLPILISFLSAVGIFAQYKFSQHEQLLKPYNTEEKTDLKLKTPKQVTPSAPNKTS
jgi:hypothetical protein